MSHDPAWMRTTSRLLSGLLQTDEADVAGFVRDRVGESEIDPARAVDARAILIRLGEALREPTPERLMSLEHARRVLDEWNAGDNPAKPERAQGPIVVVEAPAPPAAPPPAIRVPIADSGKPSPWMAGRAEQVAVITPARPAVTASMSKAEIAPSLPFGGKPLAAMPPAVLDADAPQSGETEDIDLAHLMASPPTPFATSAPAKEAPRPGDVPLSLEQYANFCVERALWPDHRAHICTKYGLAAGGEEALHQHYRRALGASPELKARFDELQILAQRRLAAR